MEQDVIAQILSKYDIAYQRILTPQSGYRNISYPVVTNKQTINLILYKREPGILKRIRDANSIGNFLSDNGMPARKTYSDKILNLKSGDRVSYASIYYYLPGDTIPWEAYTMAHLKEFGSTMANMHKKLKDLAIKEPSNIAEESIKLNRRINRYFSDNGVQSALANKLGLVIRGNDFEGILKTTLRLSDQQILHMDFVRGNILFQDKQISGILDFEKSGYGIRLFDIARSLAFLIVDCKYKDETKVRKYFLNSGYIKRGELSIKDFMSEGSSLFEGLVNFFIYHDFYKFLLHNPYEYLHLNEHFVRTKERLLKTGLIDVV